MTERLTNVFNKYAAPFSSFALGAGATMAARSGAAEASDVFGLGGVATVLLTGLAVTGTQFALGVMKSFTQKYELTEGATFNSALKTAVVQEGGKGIGHWGKKFLFNDMFAGMGAFVGSGALSGLWEEAKELWSNVSSAVSDWFSDPVIEAGPISDQDAAIPYIELRPLHTVDADLSMEDSGESSVLEPDEGVVDVDMPYAHLVEDLTLDDPEGPALPPLHEAVSDIAQGIENPSKAAQALIEKMALPSGEVPEIAREYLEGSLEGHGWGTLSLADWVANGRHGFEKDLELAKELAVLALKQGSVDAGDFLSDLDRYTDVKVDFTELSQNLPEPECTVYASVGEPPVVECDNLYGRQVDMDHPFRATFVNEETGESVQSVFRREAPLDAYDFVGKEFVPRYVETAAYEDLIFDLVDDPEIVALSQE